MEWLRSAPEGQWLERKSPRIRPKALADVLVGFANAEGGLVCIGVWRRRWCGRAGKQVSEWRQAAIDFTVPPVRHRIRLGPGQNSAVLGLDQVAGAQTGRTSANDPRGFWRIAIDGVPRRL